MKYKKPIFICVVALAFFSCRYIIHLPPDHPPAVMAAEYRGFYVDDFKTILGNEKAELQLLSWAKKHNFNALSLYMSDILDCGEKNPIRQQFSSFIKRAKTKYGILQIGGVESKSKWFNTDEERINYLTMVTYNSQHPDPNEKIDVFQLEDEWTHSNPSHTFNQYMNSLEPIYQAAQAQEPKVITESYVSTFG